MKKIVKKKNSYLKYSNIVVFFPSHKGNCYREYNAEHGAEQNHFSGI